MRLRVAFVGLVALVAFVPGASASVLVVDGAGGAPYSSIQAAVAAAVDGDVVLVRSGVYGAVRVEKKGVSIVADAGALVEVAGGIHLVDTLVEHRIVLRGLVGRGAFQVPGAVPEGLRLTVARGPVRVEECVFVGADGISFSVDSPGAAGVRADVALDLSLARCDATGGDGGDAFTGGPYSAGGHGIVAAASKVSLHDCVLTGGVPPNADDLGDGAPGGHGALVLEKGSATLPTTFFAAGTAFVGTNGSVDQLCFISGDGGDGAHLDGALVVARFLDCDFSPGVQGTCGIFGTDGVDVDAVNGADGAKLPGASRTVAASSPVRELATLTLDLDAASADACFLLVSAGALWQLELATSGVLLTAPPWIGGLVPLGVAPGSGAFSLGIPVPLLPAGVDHVTVHLQGVFADPGGGWWVGGPATPLVLDAAF
ncbi:MAG: hypothetical protein ACF8XB_17820 [Planctomycetota bacterium JB042]